MDVKSPFVEAMVQVFHAWNDPDGNREDAPAFTKKLARIPPEARNQVVHLLRKQATHYPYRFVHPTWILAIIPRDRLLRRWIFGVLPPDVRRRYLQYVPLPDPDEVVWVDRVGPPRWFESWWRLWIWQKCPFPLPIPGLDHEDVLGLLWRLDDRDIIRFLRVFGLLAFAGVIRSMDRDEVVRLVFKLEPELQNLLKDLMKQALPDDPGYWPGVYPEIRKDIRRERHITLYLGLADIARVCRRPEQQANGVRLMFRLPVALGRVFQRYMASDWCMLDEEKLEEWFQQCRAMLMFLFEKGAIARPEMEENG